MKTGGCRVLPGWASTRSCTLDAKGPVLGGAYTLYQHGDPYAPVVFWASQ